MKIGIVKGAVVVLILLLAFLSNSAFGQTKREVQFSLDTLYKSHLKLIDDHLQLIDSWKQYDAFYRHVKVSMLDKELANETIETGITLFDEVWIKHSEQVELLDDSIVYLLDSLNRLSEQQEILVAQNEVYLRMLNGKLDEAAYPHTEQELMGLWRLYLIPMQLAGDASKSGLVSYNPFTIDDSLQKYNIYRLELLPDELANIYFKDGRRQNCFYEITGFSVGEPYSINCTKQQDDFEMTIHISPMPSGLEVSYEISVDTTQVIYFNGVMKH